MNAFFAFVQAGAPGLSVSDVALIFAGGCLLYFGRKIDGALTLVASHEQTLHGGKGEPGALANLERLFEWRRSDSDKLTEVKLTLERICEDVAKIEAWTEAHEKKDQLAREAAASHQHSRTTDASASV